MKQIKYFYQLLCTVFFPFLCLVTASSGTEESSSLSNEINKESIQNSSHKQMTNLFETVMDDIKKTDDSAYLEAQGNDSHIPQDVLLKLIESRATIMKNKPLWGPRENPTFLYYFVPDSPADKTKFEEGVKRWTDATCIKARQEPDRSLDDWKSSGSGAIAVKNKNELCMIEGTGLRTPEDSNVPSIMSIPPDKCALSQVVHVIGHSLGMDHLNRRVDRDDYIFIHYENIASTLDKEARNRNMQLQWRMVGKCFPDQVLETNMPIPYDYMSIMEVGTADQADRDSRAVRVTKETTAQYMLDYHREAKLLETHYDRFAVNLVYGCDKIHSDACQKNGKTPPKCKNMGYLGKDCKCLCPQAYTGDTCQTQEKWSQEENSLFPVLPNAFIKRFNNPENFDLSTQNLKAGFDGALHGDFKFCLFFTIIIETKPTHIAVLNIRQKLGVKIQEKTCSSKIINYMHENDCHSGITLFWGLSSIGNLRTECVSSVANNEPEGPFLRSRTNRLDLIYMSRLGKVCDDPSITTTVAGFHGEVGFPEHAGKKTGQTPDDGNPEKMTGGIVLGKETLTVIVGAAAATTLCCCCICLLICRRRREVEEEESSSESSDDS